MDITFLHVLQCVPHVHFGVVHLFVAVRTGEFRMLRKANIKSGRRRPAMRARAVAA